MDLRTLRWEERVAFIKRIFETANSSKHMTHYQVAEKHGVSVSLINKLLRGKSWKQEIISAGVSYEHKNSMRGPRARSVLSFLEIEQSVTTVNFSRTLEDALKLNPYDHVRESNPHLWMRFVIRSLWGLKLRKKGILKGTRR